MLRFALAAQVSSWRSSPLIVTWAVGSFIADLTPEIANRMQNMVCVETMMHLTCTNMITVDQIDHALDTFKPNGIQNLLALRSEPPHGEDKFVQIQGGLTYALDLMNEQIVSLLAILGENIASAQKGNQVIDVRKIFVLSTLKFSWCYFSVLHPQITCYTHPYNVIVMAITSKSITSKWSCYCGQPVTASVKKILLVKVLLVVFIEQSSPLER